MGDAQARLVHHVRVEEAQHAHELILSMRGAAHADARAGQRDGLLRQHLRFGGAYGARQPVQEVLQRSGDRVVVLGAEQPQAVCFANGLALIAWAVGALMRKAGLIAEGDLLLEA